MDDFILMPPPAPRFKRPRIEDDPSASIPPSPAASADPSSADPPLEAPERAAEPPEAYQEEYYCVSPDDDESERFSTRESMEPSTIDFERAFENDAIGNAGGDGDLNNDTLNEGEARAHQHVEGNVNGGDLDDENNADTSVTEAGAEPDRSPKLKIEIPRTSFRDIIGQGPAKLRLDEALLPLALPGDLCESVLTGIRAAPASILLHGPPGCGKTKLAQAVAGEARAAFLSVGPSDILSKFVGESEASVRGLFREARQKARKLPSKCAVIFFDEIDALGRSRVDDVGSPSQAAGDNSSRRVLAELLIQMTELSRRQEEEEESEDEFEYFDESLNGREGAVALDKEIEEQTVGTPTRDNKPFEHKGSQPKPRVIVVAATNRPEDCDPALLRRFAVRVLVALPSKRDRKKIIRRLLEDVAHSITSLQLEALARSTEGWSGSDLESMTREAVMAPVRETLRAAAILKKRASRAAQHQRSGAGSSEEKSTTSDIMTRESLLNGFRNLRPVCSKDFEDGIAFFLGEQENEGFGEFSARQVHYDSSDESEGGDDEAEEE